MIPEKDFAGRQTRGSRGHQEDAYAFSDIISKGNRVEGLLVVVADGMGGHTSGEEASELALEGFVRAFHKENGVLNLRLANAVTAANNGIAKALKKSPELEGMGTTLLAAVVTAEGLEWISVGDSPLYLWRDKTLKRLNADHSFRSMLHELVDNGEMTPADAAKHPLRNLLRAALIGGEIELIDQPNEPLKLNKGDVIIAATDGLQTLQDDAIAAALEKVAADSPASAVAADVLKAVLGAKNPKQDNTTIAIIKADEGGFVSYTQTNAPESGKKDTETIVMNPFQKKKK